MTHDLLSHRVDGVGSAVVLLHPIGLDLESWSDIRKFISSDYSVLSVDLRGHGRSSPTGSNPTLSDYARDVHELIRSLKLTRAAVVGLSFGGMIAQTLALEFPGDVSCLIVAGCPCTLPDSARAAIHARGSDAADGMERAIPTTLERWFTSEFIAAGGAEKTRQRLRNVDPKEWAKAWTAISRIDTAPKLNEIRAPTLCVAGEVDAAAPTAALEAIAKRIAGARLQQLPGVPHMMQIERFELFGEAIKAFLDTEYRH